jgi:hypothetical protein
MKTYSDLKSYIEDLAAKHTAIRHTSSEKHFFHSKLEEILSGIKSAVNFPAVFMADYDFSFSDAFSDNFLKNRSLALVFIDHHSDADGFDDIADIYSAMESVADDFIARIYDDKLDGKNQFLKDFQITNINGVQFSTVDNNFGIWLSVTLTSIYDMRVKPANWTDL